MPFALYRQPFWLCPDDGECVPWLRKEAALLFDSVDEAEAAAKTVNQYTAEPYEVVGVRNEVE